MHVEARDLQDSGFLRQPPPDPLSIAAGLASSVFVHAAVIVAAIAATHAAVNSEPESYIQEEIIEAKLVRLGKKPDPNRLPQREVPRKTTAPKDSIAVSKDMDPEKPEKEKEKPPPEAEEDLLTRLGDRAQAFSEIAEEREREGDPEGDPEGTELEAQAGDLYAGKLTAFFKRGWTIPTTLGDTSKLMTIATVLITNDLHVGPHKIIKSSGEPLFDQSVEDRFNQLRAQGTTLPEPPPEVARKFLGQTIAVRFTDTSGGH